MEATPLETLLARKDALDKVLSRIDVWLLIFGIFVVIGVAGESIFGIRAWWNNRKLHSVQESIDDLRLAETSRFNKEAGDARKDAAHALERAAKAEENLGNARRDAAAANERAALAEQHTAELQASLKPRRLTAEQKEKLVAVLRPFSGLPITLEWVGSGTQEVADLASDIYDTISSAGIAIPNKNILMGEYFRGVQLKYGSERRTEAESVAGFLIEAGLATKPVTARPESNAQAFAIVVGSKP